jgi:bacterioferritin
MDVRNKSIYFSRSITQGEEKTKTKLATHAKAIQGSAPHVVADTSSSWRDEIIRLLKDSLISELVYVLCSNKSARRNSTLSGEDSEFRFHTQQELAYANSLSRHIAQLEGEKVCSPSALGQLSCVAHEERPDLQPVIEANLTDEFVAILSYSRIIPLITEEDAETRHLLDEILNTEKEHAEQIKARLNNLGCK